VTEKLPIKAAKFKDLQHLKKFLIKNESSDFYENLKTSDIIENSDDENTLTNHFMKLKIICKILKPIING